MSSGSSLAFQRLSRDTLPFVLSVRLAVTCFPVVPSGAKSKHVFYPAAHRVCAPPQCASARSARPLSSCAASSLRLSAFGAWAAAGRLQFGFFLSRRSEIAVLSGRRERLVFRLRESYRDSVGLLRCWGP
eukprot:gene3021-biopygen12666